MRLSDIAEIYATSGRHSILHEGARRRQTVTCNPEGVDVATFVKQARKAVAAQVKFPSVVYMEFVGAPEAAADAQKQLLLHSVIAAVGILLLLVIVFNSWRNLLLVLVNVPFALVGGVLFALGMRLIEGEGGLSIGQRERNVHED